MSSKRPRYYGECLPVIVPRNSERLIPVSSERVDELRDHLRAILNSPMSTSDPHYRVGSSTMEPTGFSATVAHTACSLCKGSCCRNGANDAFLDKQTLTKVHVENPRITGQSVVQLYVSRVPDRAYEGSCIFHAEHGCTLDRSMRTETCNTYFCGGLTSYLSGGQELEPTVVLAGEGNEMHASSILEPKT